MSSNAFMAIRTFGFQCTSEPLQHPSTMRLNLQSTSPKTAACDSNGSTLSVAQCRHFGVELAR
eukprot:1773863-Alexandrium_andersonii.AAC.1